MTGKSTSSLRGGTPRPDLEDDPAVICVLDRRLHIVYCNAAWDRFAAENGGVGLERERQLGRALLDVVPEPLRPLISEGFRGVITGGSPWRQVYECSSPSVFRRFQLAVYPDSRSAGLVAVHSLLIERPHDPAEREAQAAGPLYIGQDGLIRMCCHCRRTRRAQPDAAWDWVPAYVEHPPTSVSHWICETCLNLFYPDAVQRA